MELFKKTIAEIKPLDKEAMELALKRQDNLAKPLGSLGRLEEISIQLAGIRGIDSGVSQKECTVVMCADNGIFEEGVSSCPQHITIVQSVNFVKGLTGISVLSRHAGSDIRVFDVGINSDFNYPGLINKKIRKSTWNMAKGPAMTREEAIRSIEIGIEAADDLAKEGYGIIGTGEMGIGNTSTSSAVLMSLTGCDVSVGVGKGAGMTDEGYLAKKETIRKAVKLNDPDPKDPIDILCKVGGFDIGGMTGVFLGGAKNRIPVVIDGFISAVAALLAYKLNPETKNYMIPSHISEEPGYKLAMDIMGLESILNLHMRLGEGTGCPLVFGIIKAADAIMNEMATFAEAEIVNDYLIDIRE